MNRTLTPAMLTVIVDTREQRPWSMSPFKMERRKLDVGDYSIKGLENEICLERKSVPDLVQCCGSERDRFRACLDNMLKIPNRAVIVEGTWLDLEAGNWVGLMKPNAVCGTVLGWIAEGIPVIMGHDPQTAARQAARLLLIAARRHHAKVLRYLDAMGEKTDGQ